MTDEQPIPTDPVSSESKGWAVAAHIVPLLGFPLVGPLIVWVIKHESDPFVEEHAREALNFWISVFVYAFISVLLVIVLIGILMLIVLGIFSFVAAIVAAIKAANGDEFRYPLTIRLIKP